MNGKVSQRCNFQQTNRLIQYLRFSKASISVGEGNASDLFLGMREEYGDFARIVSECLKTSTEMVGSAQNFLSDIRHEEGREVRFIGPFSCGKDFFSRLHFYLYSDFYNSAVSI